MVFGLIYKLRVWFGLDDLLLPTSALFTYLFIYLFSLPVCKIARVPLVAWQRAWQWALLTLRPRPRTARALKIDPGRLTLIENKKNARRAERRSYGSTGKKGACWMVGTMRYENITVHARMRYRLSDSAGEPKMFLFMADLMRAVGSQNQPAVRTNDPE